MLTHVNAILWAQFRTFRGFYPRGHRGRTAITGLLSAVWYGMWLLGAVFVGLLLAETRQRDTLLQLVSRGLAVVFLYWQVIPILMASTGASLDLKRLRVYPIPSRQMFTLEVFLRLSTSIEMILVLGGATAGLLANETVPFWAPLGFVPFLLMNLFISAGVKQLLTRLMARKHVRELVIILLILAAATPHVLLLRGVSLPIQEVTNSILHPALPFAAVSRISVGDVALTPWLALLAWTVLAYAFGRWQFERSLVFDRDEAGAAAGRRWRASWTDRLFRWPSLLFSDPLAALVEKELRFLSRAPRFRLVFVMGFSFGLLVWLPIAFAGGRGGGSIFAANYLTFVSVYALLLLAEATFWNAFGFDRAAAQLYFLIPADIAAVLRGKNIAAASLVVLEVTLVALACLLLGMPMTFGKLGEAYSVACVLTLLVLAAGNLASAHYARPVDPKQSWRTGSTGRFQAMLLLLYPVITFPVTLAFLARYAFDSNLAFYSVLLFDTALGGVVYWVSIGSAVDTIRRHQETMLSTLAERSGPVAT